MIRPGHSDRLDPFGLPSGPMDERLRRQEEEIESLCGEVLARYEEATLVYRLSERIGSVLAALRGVGARRVLDLGCGEGRLMVELEKDHVFTEIVGMSPTEYRSQDHSAAAVVPACIEKVRNRPSRIREAKPVRSA